MPKVFTTIHAVIIFCRKAFKVPATMNPILCAVFCLVLIWQPVGEAQVSPAPPKNYERSSMLMLNMRIDGLKLPGNKPELVRRELLDTNTLRLIAKAKGLSAADLATVQVAQERGISNWLQVYQLGKNGRPFEVLNEQLRLYVRGRAEGHTPAFLLAAMTNRIELSKLTDPALRAIATNQTLIPLSWLKLSKSGATTNKAGQEVSRTYSISVVNGKSVTNETIHIPKVDEVCRWTEYNVIDGEVAWRYWVQFKADGNVDYIHHSRCDAKDFDPKYEKVIKEIEKEVKAEMKRNGSSGRFGSVHSYWGLKKEKLQAKGIAWRSPSELNPGTDYD